MNLDIVKSIYANSFANTPWEDFLNQLETGMVLIQGTDDLSKSNLADMRAANLALTYNHELMMHHLMN